MFGFVICHLTDHSLLLVSLQFANAAHHILIDPWRTDLGTTVLITAALTHYANALWSIYVRRHLRLSRWEWWQLGLGLCIPPLLMLHVVGTRIAERLLNVSSDYNSVLVVLWRVSPWLAIVQAAALLTVWVHASIGIHFWLRTKSWYPASRGLLAAIGLLIPTLALAGYVSGGNQVLRAARNAGYVTLSSKMRT